MMKGNAMNLTTTVSVTLNAETTLAELDRIQDAINGQAAAPLEVVMDDLAVYSAEWIESHLAHPIIVLRATPGFLKRLLDDRRELKPAAQPVSWAALAATMLLTGTLTLSGAFLAMF